MVRIWRNLSAYPLLTGMTDAAAVAKENILVDPQKVKHGMRPNNFIPRYVLKTGVKMNMRI